MQWLKGKHLYFVLCKRQKESDDSIDENVDLHKEYLDELDLISVAKEFAEKFDGKKYLKFLIFLFFVCQDFLYYIKLLIIKLFTHCSAPLISSRVAATV